MLKYIKICIVICPKAIAYNKSDKRSFSAADIWKNLGGMTARLEPFNVCYVSRGCESATWQKFY